MATVWKYTMNQHWRQEIEMPQGARIVTVQLQYEEATLWVLVDQDAPTETRVFYLFGTGSLLPGQSENGHLNYIGTVQFSGGALVAHIFEEIGGMETPQ